MKYLFRILMLDKLDDASLWEEEMNEVGAEAWELIALVDDGTHHRAIFQKEMRFG